MYVQPMVFSKLHQPLQNQWQKPQILTTCRYSEQSLDMRPEKKVAFLSHRMYVQPMVFSQKSDGTGQILTTLRYSYFAPV